MSAVLWLSLVKMADLGSTAENEASGFCGGLQLSGGEVSENRPLLDSTV